MSIGNLVHLRHLDISDTRELEKMPLHIGNLVNLQTLSNFIVEKGNSSSRIKELKKLTNIRGTLSILGLHNVVNAQDLKDVNLEKRKIEELAMEWGNDNIDDPQPQGNEMQVLEYLQPASNLKKLAISFYVGGTFPSWIMNPSFSQMVQLHLKDCRNCAVLPSLGQLSSLRNLCIEGMGGIRNIGVEFYGQSVVSFPSLERLTFSDMLEWVDWCCPSSVDEERSLFPLLRQLIVRRCPKFVGELPSSLSFLVKLNIEECPKLICPLPRVHYLEELKFRACNEVVLGRIGFNFKSLATLEITDCKEVRRLGLENLGGLKRLVMNGCDGLISLEELVLPCNLEYLIIESCKNLRRLPNEMQCLRSLTELSIAYCPNLVNISDMENGWPPMLREFVVAGCKGALPKGELPASLKHLTIADCENVETPLEGIMCSTCNLEGLRIWGCSYLTSFPSGVFPSTLKSLLIYRCGNLKLLPLDQMHNLTSLHIGECEGLEFQQDHMQNLTSLRYLWISECPGLVSFPEGGLRFALSLIGVGIVDCENLSTPLSQWGLDWLTSLSYLAISPGGYKNVVSFSDVDDDCCLPLPTSLASLLIGRFQNLESTASLPLHALISLECLGIENCPKLRQFLPKEGLPPTLGRLYIKGCPIVEKRCIKDRGQDWPHISHIPCIKIGAVDHDSGST